MEGGGVEVEDMVNENEVEDPGSTPFTFHTLTALLLRSLSRADGV